MTVEERMLLILEEIRDFMKEEDRRIPSWSLGIERLMDKYVTTKNAMKVAGVIAGIYTTYFLASVANAPGT